MNVWSQPHIQQANDSLCLPATCDIRIISLAYFSYVLSYIWKVLAHFYLPDMSYLDNLSLLCFPVSPQLNNLSLFHIPVSSHLNDLTCLWRAWIVFLARFCFWICVSSDFTCKSRNCDCLVNQSSYCNVWRSNSALGARSTVPIKNIKQIKYCSIVTIKITCNIFNDLEFKKIIMMILYHHSF